MDTFRIEFKKLAHEKKLTRGDMALHCLSKATLKEPELDYERATLYLQKSFTPVRKESKLRAGAHPYMSLYLALGEVRHSPLWSLLTDEQRDRIYPTLTGTLRSASYGEIKFHE